MKYIGSYFRMHTVSKDNIKNQLFFLAKESIKTIALTSRCGIRIKDKDLYNKNRDKDTNTNSKYYPLASVYKRSSPELIHNKSSVSFDESTFKKEIDPLSNALMTVCLINLSNYYLNYDNINRKESSLSELYRNICKKQLDFYYENLRNDDGFFVTKKLISDTNSENNLSIKDINKIDLASQSFMMLAYYLYAKEYKNHKEASKENDNSDDYINFSFEILSMFLDCKQELYNLSFDENVKILFSFNLFYIHSKKEECIELITDLCDFLVDKFESKNYYSSSIDDVSLFAICLKDSYTITNIQLFKDKSLEILENLKNLYQEENNIFIKPAIKKDKKDIKYSCSEIMLYFISMMILEDDESYKSGSHSNLSMISNLYKKMVINSGIICSFPETPSLDEIERYRNLSLLSTDMLEEINFRMPRIQNPRISSLAPVFIKNILYSKKKDSFTIKHKIFESNKNFLIFLLILNYFSNDAKTLMGFLES